VSKRIRDLMIRAGSSPTECALCARMPERGQAQGRNDPGSFALGAAPAETSGHGPQTGVKAQKPIQAHVIRRAMSALMFLFLSEGAASQPDENQSGRDGWTNRQVGPARSEMIRHP
jgi:hypothetical protein